MTATSTRRTILAGAVTLPALSLPAIAEANPDAELLALGRKLEAAWETLHTYQDGPQKEIMDRYHELVPPKPIELPYDKMPRKLAKQIPWFGAPGTQREYLTVGEYAILKKFAPKHPVVLWQDECTKKNRENWRKGAKERERIARISEQCGADEAEAEWERLFDECWNIFGDILKTPAHTVAGMAVKVRSIKYVAMEDDLVDPERAAADFWQSLRTDIQQLAGAKSELATWS